MASIWTLGASTFIDNDKKIMCQVLDGGVKISGKDIGEFYDFDLDKYQSHFRQHISDKNWCSPDLIEFLDNQIEPC